MRPISQLLAGLVVAAVSCRGGLQAASPPSSPERLFADVRSLLERRCVDCHGYDASRGDFSLESRSRLLEHPRAVVPGDPVASRLIALVRGDDPELEMPPKGPRLTTAEVALLERWIADGVPWPAGFAFRDGADDAVASIEPRRPAVPGGPEDGHPIDRLLERYALEHAVELAPLIDDASFVRRAGLDLVGLPPTPEALDAFLRDDRPDKRARLVRGLLDDDEAMATHWLTFWNDLLRNDYSGTGYIDGGRRQITGWLYAALRDEMPYDEFVAALVDPSPASAGFADGIVWRGETSVAQSPALQYAQNVGQVFLGVNMKCASCHDSFVDHWTLREAYGLAAIYADEPLELHRCDVPLGETAIPSFPFPALGNVESSMSRQERLRRLAELMTSARNGRTARTIVNRLWAALMGRGLVEPVDVMDGVPWSRDLLDHLASHLVDHGFDLEAVLAHIATSRAYQRASVPPAADDDTFVFRGPTPRRLTAEQMLDAIWALSGAGPAEPTAPIGSSPSARWIWSDAAASSGRPPGETVELRRDVELSERPAVAMAVVTCDNAYELSVNGRVIAADDDWPSVERLDLADALVAGRNRLSIVARNLGTTPNPAGLCLELVLVNDRGERHTIVTDASWSWRPPGAGDDAWRPAAELEHQAFLGPLVQTRFGAALLGIDDDRRPRVRAALVEADPLMRSLGRPNREQVVSRRPNELTMLQALHLTNGPQITRQLEAAARRLLETQADAPAIVDEVYLRLLSRHPTPTEQRLALELLGDAVEPAAVEDLVWSVIMLPEFQLVP